MRRKDVKTIITYFYGIPAQRRELNKERAELEDEYSGLRGMSMDGLPHSSTPGKPVEELAERVDARGVWGKLEAVAVKVHVLEADQEKIRDCLNAINGEYTRLISYRYRDKYSWVKIAVKLGITERTAKRWGERALDRLGEALEEVSMPDEILGRASRARLRSRAGPKWTIPPGPEKRFAGQVLGRQIPGLSGSIQGLKGKKFEKFSIRKCGDFRAQEKPLEKQFANRRKEARQGRFCGPWRALCCGRVTPSLLVLHRVQMGPVGLLGALPRFGSRTGPE